MNVKLPHFEKYSIAPSPNRDYYGIKVYASEVILYEWKVSHGPHLLPAVRLIKFSELSKEKAVKEQVEHVFGRNVLRYLELISCCGANTLLTLPKEIIEKLVKYLNLQDVVGLLRASPVSAEVFDTDSVWRILYANLKGSTELSNMERDMVANRGFKKLVKDQHARSAAKKSIKSIDDKLKRSLNASSKAEKVVRSASVNIPKISLQDDGKSAMAKRNVQPTAGKIAKASLKSHVKTSSQAKAESCLSLPKKSMSEEQSSIPVDIDKRSEKNMAAEAYRQFKSMKEVVAKKATAEQEAMSKFKFMNDDKEKTELLLPNKFLKSSGIARESDLSDSDLQQPEELLKSKSMTIASPRGSFNKRSRHVLGDAKVKLPRKVSKGKKCSEPARCKIAKSARNLRSDEKSEDSDESGMSFLMKRYLEASNEVAKKFSECQRLTKNSSVQVDMASASEIASERKPAVKKMQKYGPFLEKSASRKKC